MRRAKRRAVSCVVLVGASFFVIAAPPAHADLINGACTLDMTFTFSTAPTTTGASGYTIAIDQNNSSCTLDSLDPTPSVTASGSADAGNGGTSLTNCETLAGAGPWDQGFGGGISPVYDGSHTVAGTWLHATMHVTAYPNDSPARFNGVIDLTPYPTEPLANAYKVETCANAGTVTSIRMLGVEVINDPTVG